MGVHFEILLFIIKFSAGAGSPMQTRFYGIFSDKLAKHTVGKIYQFWLDHK